MFHPQGPTFLEQARQALSSTQRGYDLLAPKFEFTPYATPDWMLSATGSLIGEVDSALDVCCGTGLGMRMLRPRCRERLVGIDFSTGMLEEARRRVAETPGPARVEFVQGDVLEMDFAEEFDAAVCFGALGHFVGLDEDALIDRVYRALKPGGRFLFVTGYPPKVTSPNFWFAHGFNAAMHVRNWLIEPPFIMFFLTFLLPEIQRKLEARGFTVRVEAPEGIGKFRVVVATRA